MYPHTLDTSGGRVVGSAREFVIPNPGAGKDWQLLLPSGYYYRLLFGRALFVTSAQVATRSPGFQIIGGDQEILYQIDPGATLTATAATGVSYAASGPFSTGATSAGFAIGLPPAFIPGGFTIGSSTTALQTEDTYNAIRLWVEQVWDVDPMVAPGHEPEHHHRQHPALVVALEG